MENNFENIAEQEKDFTTEYCPNCEGAGVRDGCAVCDSEGIVLKEKASSRNLPQLEENIKLENNKEESSEKEEIERLIKNKDLLERILSNTKKAIDKKNQEIESKVRKLIDFAKIPVIEVVSTNAQNTMVDGAYYILTKEDLSGITRISSSKSGDFLVTKNGDLKEFPESMEYFDMDSYGAEKSVCLHIAENPELIAKYAKENKAENYCVEHGPCHVCDRYNECSDIDMDK